MTYIVTGIAGFIGFHTARKLLNEGHTVLGIDSINGYYDISLKIARLNELGINRNIAYCEKKTSAVYPKLRFIKINLEDKNFIKTVTNEKTTVDCIIHLAAQAGVRYSLQNPGVYIQSNIDGFLNILELSRFLNIAHLIYASSSSVYGLNTNHPYSVHTDTSHPVSLYAATKKSNELMAHAYSHLFKIPVTGLRFFTVYGPWGRPDMAYYKFSLSIMRDRPIEVYNNGDMYRDFTYIDDIVEGILKVSNHIPVPSPCFNSLNPDPACSSAPFRIYNLGNNHPQKLTDFIKVLENALGKKANVKFLPLQDGDVVFTEADIEDSKADLHWEPHTDIEEGLNLFAEWFLNYFNK
jgi:UDP-glucuronate 4-epimerase